MTPNDKAGTKYWNNTWESSELSLPFDAKNKSLDNYVNLQLHTFFKELLKDKKNLSVLEIGCANSIWPIYFHQYFKATVSGLDYSEIGCEKSRALLKYHKVPGIIHCANLFDPPKALQHQFDLVVSFGVVEHFENTAECLQACAKFLKPEGILFTLIPNIPSVIGFIQRFVDRSIYDIHVPLTKKTLAVAHKDTGLKLLMCDHFMSINLGVVNSGKFSKNRFNPILRHALSSVSKICWILEKYGIRIPKNRFTSPYILSIANLPPCTSPS